MKTAILILVLATAAFTQNADPVFTPGPNLPSFGTVAAFNNPGAIHIYNSKGLVIRIGSVDGTVVLGDGVTPNEAAKEFIKALHSQWPSFCPTYTPEPEAKK